MNESERPPESSGCVGIFAAALVPLLLLFKPGSISKPPTPQTQPGPDPRQGPEARDGWSTIPIRARSRPDEPSPPRKSSASIAFVLPSARTIVCERQPIELPAGTTLDGLLSITPSDGPGGERVYACPEYFEVTFDFRVGGRLVRWLGFLSPLKIFLPSGGNAALERPDFLDMTGEVQSVLDWRDDWTFALPDGRQHSNRTKYTDTRFRGMPWRASLLVRCCYYDQNEDLGGYVTIYYERPWADLLLLPDSVPFLDPDGRPVEWTLYAGESITVEPVTATEDGAGSSALDAPR